VIPAQVADARGQGGVELLEQHGVDVLEMPAFAKEAKAANAHLNLG
jgi:hypothetical protein